MAVSGLNGSSLEDRLRYGVHAVPVWSGGDGLASYLVKESTKTGQTSVPEGDRWVGRFWGHVGEARCKAERVPWSVVARDPEAVAGRLVDLDRVLRPKRASPDSTPPLVGSRVLRLASRYVASGDALDLVAFREAAWAVSGRRGADGRLLSTGRRAEAGV